MSRTVASRGLFLSLLVVGLGLVATLWWLSGSERLGTFMAPAARNAPAGQPNPSAAKPAPAPDQPAAKAIAEANETLKELGNRLGQSTPAPMDLPAFDVARVDPDGTAVIAGRAVPGSVVELLVNGQVHDRTTADATGAFVHVPKPLPPGDHTITLRATTPTGSVNVSKTPVTVTLRPTQETPVAALTTPTRPTAAGSTPPATTPAPQLPHVAPQAKPLNKDGSKPASKDGEIRIEVLEAKEGGGLFIAGVAAPGARVRLYMNGGHVGTGTASQDGRISFSIGSGVRGGDYRIRLDQMSALESVVSTVEVPFRVRTASAAPSLLPPSPSQAPDVGSAPAIASQPEVAPAATASAAPPPEPASAREKPTAVATASAPQAIDRTPPAQVAPPTVVPAPPATSRSTVPTTEANAIPVPQPAAGLADPNKNDVSTRQPEQAPVTASNAESKARNNGAPRGADTASDRRNAVIIPSIDTKLIIRGDNLWRISQSIYGLGQRYTVIFGANRDKIRDPDLIYPGQIFVLPKSTAN